MISKPHFHKTEPDLEHFRNISLQVRQLLDGKNRHNHWSVRLKIILFPTMYFLFFAFALSHREDFLSYALAYSGMGLTGIFIFLNLFHEATHGLLFTSKTLNRLFLYFFDLLGPNSYIWINRHNRLHHNYPNLHGWDSDIEQSGPVRLVHHQPRKGSHHWQHYYVFLLYPLYIFNWIFIRDFRDYFQSGRIVGKLHSIPKAEYLKLFLFKILFIGYTFLLPISLGVPVLQAVLSVMLFTVSGSILALLVLLTPHANAGNEFPELGEDGQINSSWFRHQLNTTNDVYFNNWFARNIMGNFHCHVAHHLFPNISYVYAQDITDLVASYAREHALPYKRYSIWESLALHYKLIRQNAVGSFEVFAEDM